MIAQRNRRGGALVIGLVALVILAMIEGVLIQGGLARRRLLQAEERRLQAAWLGESGLDRAAAAQAKDTGYKGETWEVSADELGGRESAVVRLEVEPAEGRAERRRVRIHVDYPREGPVRTRWEHDYVIDTGSNAGGEL
jgi:hypothetical protein